MSLNKTVSEKIKEIRLKKEMTQREVAQILNKERTTYNKMELGKADITLDTLEKLSAIFEVEVSHLLNLTNSTINQPSNIGALSSNGINSTLTVNIPMELLEELKKAFR